MYAIRSYYEINDPVMWVTGNVNGQKAHYTENMTLPYQLELINLVPDSTYTVTIGWDTKKNGKHALDFLTSYDREYMHDVFYGIDGHPDYPETIEPLAGTALEGTTPVENRYEIPTPEDTGWSASNTQGYTEGDMPAFFDAMDSDLKQFSIFNGHLANGNFLSTDYTHDPFVRNNFV